MKHAETDSHKSQYARSSTTRAILNLRDGLYQSEVVTMKFGRLPTYSILYWAALSISHVLSDGQVPLHLQQASYKEALRRAAFSFGVLQEQYYSYIHGLYKTTGWWNAANIIATIADVAIVNPVLSRDIELILENTFMNAPKHNPTRLGYKKTINPETFLVTASWISLEQERATQPQRSLLEQADEMWLNDYYDDEAWWALAWLKAYDLTLNTTYLSSAIYIFNDLQQGTTTPCGGIWWNKNHTYVNAITNELYLTVAASLSNRALTASERDKYLSIALEQWKWFLNSGMINDACNINDGLSSDCTNNGGTIWSYNQGVILAGLSELWIATHDDGYLDIAMKIAKAAFEKLTTDQGILRDRCETNGCGADGVQFKGVFLRGLSMIYQVVQEGEGKNNIARFVNRNAESIWTDDQDDVGRIGVSWSGPLSEVNAGSHGSGLDALIAAADAGSFR